MNSTFKTSSDTLRITLTGDLIGGADAMKFAVDLREALNAPELKRVDVDAADVGFVNSSGLGMLIAARQAAQEHGASFQLQQPGEQLKSLLNITKLTELLGA